MIIFKILLCFVPWKLRRLLLNKFFHVTILFSALTRMFPKPTFAP